MASVMFSIIVPVYNTERYLKQCVESILAQEYKNFELILIDDGSIDNSAVMCDEYAKSNENVIVIHKENGGAADARNIGLLRSSGNYVLFVDSDDFIEKGSLESIAKFVYGRKLDIVFLKGYKYFDENNIQELDENIDVSTINDKFQLQEYISKLKKLPGSACTKLVSREFALKNDLFFVKGMYAEDIEWFIKMIKKVESFDALNTSYYYYRQNRNGSVTNKVTAKHINSMIDILETYAAKNIDNIEDKYINNYLAYEYIIALALYMKLSKDNKCEVKRDIYEYKWLLKYNNNKKVKLAYIANSLLGIRATAYLLKMVLNYKEKKV